MRFAVGRCGHKGGLGVSGVVISLREEYLSACPLQILWASLTSADETATVHGSGWHEKDGYCRLLMPIGEETLATIYHQLFSLVSACLNMVQMVHPRQGLVPATISPPCDPTSYRPVFSGHGSSQRPL